MFASHLYTYTWDVTVSMKFACMNCGNDLFTSSLYYTHRHMHTFFLFLARSICKTTSLILSSHWCPSQWGVFRLSFMYPSHSHLGIFRAIWSACCRSRRIPHAFKTAVAGDFFQCCDWQAQEERSEGEGMGCGEGHSRSFGSDILQAHRLINQFPLKKRRVCCYGILRRVYTVTLRFQGIFNL